MNTRRMQWLFYLGMTIPSLLIISGCRRSGEVDRAAPETRTPWTLTLSSPIDHLDVVAREPMIVEHPDGTLFVAGYGAAWISGNRMDEPTLWKSHDGGMTWTRINVRTEAQGATGNSDVDWRRPETAAFIS